MPGQPATPPLAPASIYVSQGTPRPGRGYGRDGNPGWEALEQALGGLEDAEAVAFASGQAASMALMLALTPGRERIVLPAWQEQPGSLDLVGRTVLRDGKLVYMMQRHDIETSDPMTIATRLKQAFEKHCSAAPVNN